MALVKMWPGDLPSEYDKLPPDTQKALAGWIKKHFSHSKQANMDRTSYGYKHNFSSESGPYITNGAFKGAMLAAGFAPVDDSAQNWCFRAKCNWKPARLVW